MAELRSQPLFILEVTLHPFQDVGAGPRGQRRVVPISGGTFEGSRLRGTVLPLGGTDSALFLSDGTARLDVRATLKTDDDAFIYLTYVGIRRGPPEVFARMARGETVAASEYYFRIAPLLETGHPKYQWVNEIVTIGVGERLPDRVRYDVFEIL